MRRIIAVTNQKGGCGKTTTALNLSAALSANDRKVLLIDLDPQSHATLGLNIKADANIYDVLSKMSSRKTSLGNIIVNVAQNFDIAPSGIVLSTIEQELAGEIGRESCLWDILHNFNADYDYVIIDCPPNLGILTVNAIRSASEIIIPVEASRFSLEGVAQLTEIVNLIKDRLHHEVEYRVLVANFDSRLRHSFEMLNRIKGMFENKLFSTIIHVNVKLKEAQNHGSHIFDFDRYCRGAKDYFSLSREVVMQEQGSREQPSLETKMKEILRERLPQLNEVIFSLQAPQAREVYVAGDFNDWKLDEHSRMDSADGVWKKNMKLAAGRHRYRFVIDGKWVEDPNNPVSDANPFGQLDSLLEILNQE